MPDHFTRIYLNCGPCLGTVSCTTDAGGYNKGVTRQEKLSQASRRQNTGDWLHEAADGDASQNWRNRNAAIRLLLLLTFSHYFTACPVSLAEACQLGCTYQMSART